MANKETLLTLEGVEKLEKELEYLKTVKRREIAAKIKQALAFGDLSENAEYDEAKNEQAFVEGRISTLENMLRNAKVIDEDEIDTKNVTIGSIVVLEDAGTGEEEEYTIVGSAEADPFKHKISNESPVGKALLGKSKGDVVEINVPDGVIKYRVVDIKK